MDYSSFSAFTDMGFVLNVGIVSVLVFVSAFFSCSETAFTGTSRAKIHQLGKRSNKKALAKAQHLLNHIEQVIGTVLFANTLVNILIAAIVTEVCVRLAGPAGIGIATIVTTTIVVYIGEVMPKMLAVNHPEQTALRVAGILTPIVKIFIPIAGLFSYCSRHTWRFLGVNIRAKKSLGTSLEELRGAIDLRQGTDPALKEERAMLHSILDLTEIEVCEIMIHRKDVKSIDVSMPPQKIIEEVLASPYTRIPLWKDNPDNIVGILHSKELFRASRAHEENISKLNIEQIALKPLFVPETTTLLNQLTSFRKRHEHFAVVVDEYGSHMGIVTLEDILEEIVGDIADEYDVESLSSGILPQNDGSFIVKGDITIRDLNRQFNWNLPDEEAATLAGLVLYESRRIPDVGQTFAINAFKITVLRRQRNQITLLRVEPKHH